MALRIPEDQKKTVEKLALLSEDALGQLEKALMGATPAITHRALAQQIGAQVDLPLADLTAMLLVLGSLILTKNNHRQSSEEVALETATVAREQGLAGATPAEGIPGIEAVLRRLLSISSLELTMRAGSVYFAHRNLYHSSRILSDIRSLFAPGDPNKPVVGLIVHNLELVVSDQTNDRKHYFALNVHDLRELHRVIERALLKDAALARAIKDSGMVHIEDVPNPHQL